MVLSESVIYTVNIVVKQKWCVYFCFTTNKTTGATNMCLYVNTQNKFWAILTRRSCIDVTNTVWARMKIQQVQHLFYYSQFHVHLSIQVLWKTSSYYLHYKPVHVPIQTRRRVTGAIYFPTALQNVNKFNITLWLSIILFGML